MYMFAIVLPRYFAVVASFQTFESYILMYVPLPVKRKKKDFYFYFVGGNKYCEDIFI